MSTTKKNQISVCHRRTASKLVKHLAKNSTFVQKQLSPSVTLKVNLILILDVRFILMFK